MIDKLTQIWCILKSQRATDYIEDIADMLEDEIEVIKDERKEHKELIFSVQEIKRAIEVALQYERPTNETMDISINSILYSSLNTKTVREAMGLINDKFIKNYPLKPSEAISNDPFE